ncbi:hypothetical protein V8E53_013940 [Lactarius tabidus]
MEADDSDVDELEEDKLEEDEWVAPPKRCQTYNRGGNTAEVAHPHKRKGDSLPPCKTIKCCTRLLCENPELGKNLGEGSYKFEMPEGWHHMNTGKKDQCNLMEADIFCFCISQLKNLKKQQACGHKNPEALGSKTSPLTTLSAVDLESWSSHLPPAAPNSPAAATATALPDPSSQSLPSLTALTMSKLLGMQDDIGGSIMAKVQRNTLSGLSDE